MRTATLQSIYRTRIHIGLHEKWMSQRQLCRLIGISPTYLTLMLQGKRPILKKHRENIANVLEVDFGD